MMIKQEPVDLGKLARQKLKEIMIKQGITGVIGQELCWDAEILGKQTKMTASMELLDKDKAQEMLSKPHLKQRSIISSHVDKLKQAMNNGEFIEAVINPIFISDTDLLLDGQNRLTALSHTDKTIPFFVVRGLPEETFVYLDQNRPRSAKDALKGRGVKNPDKVASTAKLLYQLMENKRATARNEILDRMVTDYPAMENAVAQAEAICLDIHLMPSIGATLFFLYNAKWPVQFARFYHLLDIGGDELTDKQNPEKKNANHPVVKLKKRLLQQYKLANNPFGKTWKTIQGAANGTITWDSRYPMLSWTHQAFMAFTREVGVHNWKDWDIVIPAVGKLAREIITVRHSYKDSYHSDLDQIVEHYDDGPKIDEQEL